MEELFKAMEEKISNLKKLTQIMDEMKGVTQSLKEGIKIDQDFKNLINIGKIDEWSFSLIKNLQEIEKVHAVELGKASPKLSDLNYLNWDNIKTSLTERGIEVVKDEEVIQYFNNAIDIAINYFITKQQARKKAKDLVAKSRKKIKTKKARS